MLQDSVLGFVLHRRPYRETSALVQFFSAELGRVDAVVRGIRGKKSSTASLVQMFQPLQLSFVGRGELKSTKTLEADGAAIFLSSVPLFCGLYVNELLSRLLVKELPCPGVFERYCATLQGLADGNSVEPLLRELEFTLLEELGYGIDFAGEAQNGQAIESQAYYTLAIEQGWRRLNSPIQSPNCFQGQVLHWVANQDWQPEALACAKYVTRLALAPLLGNKPLKSRELFGAPSD